MDTERRIAFLQRLALTTAQTLDPQSLVRLVIAETTAAMGVDVCSVYLLEADGRALLLTATNGLSQTGVGRVRLRVGEGITGVAAESRAPVVVADVRADARFRWLPGVDQARFVSMCSVPIVSGDRLVGVLNVQTDSEREFAGPEVELLAAIAAQVAGVLERAALQARLEDQVADLRRSADVHRRFTDLSLRGAGLDAICNEIARHASSTVALFDDEGERLAPAGPDALPATIPTPSASAEGDALRILPVQAGSEILAWLAAIDEGDVPEPVRRRAFEHGVTVLALELSRERATAEAERRLRGDLMEELLVDDLTEAEAARLVDRASRMGYRLRQSMWVAAVEADDPAAAQALSDRSVAPRIIRAVTALADQQHPGAIVVSRGGSIVMLVPGSAHFDQVERFALGAITAAGGLSGGNSFSCGISGTQGGPADLHRLLGQARMAVRVGRRRQHQGEVHAHRRLAAERLLASVSSDELSAFIDEWLGPLERLETQGKAAAPLVATIDALAACGWSPKAAARRLNVHVNTLLYRVRRVREIAGHDLDDTDVRLALALALRAREMAAPAPQVAAARFREPHQ